MVLMPRLLSMNLDSPDARKYFGLRSALCCSKCKRRKGRSAFRVASRQNGEAVQVLYGIYENSMNKLHVRLAKEKLLRWGFSPDNRCLLPVVCKRLLVRRHESKNEVFPGVDYRDQLHGMTVFLHRKISEVFTEMRLPKKTRVLLDQRLAYLGLHRHLHDPSTGRSYRVQRSLFTEANMTAQDRMCTLFFLPHVLGHEAADLPLELREPVLTAVACAQIFVIASRGGRAYNVRELRAVFDRTWIIFFGAMETIVQRNVQLLYNKRMEQHLKNPTKYRRPKEFQRANR